MRKINCKVQFGLIKAHVGILGNELAGALSKKAEKKADIIECYKKFQSVVISELSERSVEKWHKIMGPNNKGTKHKRIFPGSG